MTMNVLNQAKVWGFICKLDQNDNWQILPQQKTARWELRIVVDRWLLLVADVPQAYLHPPEALAFLKRRQSSRKELEAATTCP